MARNSNKSIKKALLSAAGAALAGLSVYTVHTDLHVCVTHYSTLTDKVSSPLRIVQVSDFHNDRLIGNKMLEKVRSESPDIIVITGDFIDRNRTSIKYALETAASLVKAAPVYYVPGNHESAVSSYGEFRDGLAQMGVIFPDSSPARVGSDILVYGIDDPFFATDDHRKSKAVISNSLSGIAPDSSKYTILLSHRPEAFNAYASSGFDLVFAGHAHGGQFRLPGIGGIFAPGQGLMPEYDAGEFVSGSTTMIVSRGVGKSIMPLRIGNPPEIVVTDIKPLD